MNANIFNFIILLLLVSCGEKYVLRGDYDPKEIDKIRIRSYPVSPELKVDINQSEFRVSLAGNKTSVVDWIEVVAEEKSGREIRYLDKIVIPGRSIRLEISKGKISERVENEGHF